MTRSVGVITGGRADYGILQQLLRAIVADPALDLRLYVTGMHLSADYGHTVDAIEFPIAARVDLELSATDSLGISHSMSRAVYGFAKVFAESRPDILVVLGDRSEILAAVVAATPFLIPIAHMCGGDITEGAIDDAMRHAISKLSHLHFASIKEHAERLKQMGEQPENIHVVGIPTLDHLRTINYLSQSELEGRIGIGLDGSLLVTFHPETLEPENTVEHCKEILYVLGEEDRPIVFTAPNNDVGGLEIKQLIDEFVQHHPNSRFVHSLGTQGYFSLLKIVSAMVGNTSSGIIEAASLSLPVVDVGDRQKGRLAGANVLHCAPESDHFRASLRRALDPSFRASLEGIVNPYGDGLSADRVLKVLRDVELVGLTRKRFYAPVSTR